MSLHKTEFLLLCPKVLDELMELRVRDSEKHLIAPNPEWIADAAFTNIAVTFGIYANKKPVGLISFIDPRLDEEEDNDHCQSDCLYVWRVMIDQNHRGQGHGRSAITFAKDYAQLIGLKGVSLTTMDKAALNALPLYQAMEFQPTGRRLNDEIELVWRRSQKG